MNKDAYNCKEYIHNIIVFIYSFEIYSPKRMILMTK